MKEYNFYEFYEDDQKIKIYCDDIQKYFELNYDIIINSMDFDENQNVVLYIEDTLNKVESSNLEKKLLKDIEHLSDVEVRNMKIIFTFECDKIELF